MIGISLSPWKMLNSILRISPLGPEGLCCRNWPEICSTAPSNAATWSPTDWGWELMLYKVAASFLLPQNIFKKTKVKVYAWLWHLEISTELCLHFQMWFIYIFSVLYRWMCSKTRWRTLTRGQRKVACPCTGLRAETLSPWRRARATWRSMAWWVQCWQ